MACLTFSRHREGIAKRHYQNMIRRHATWDLPTVRNLRISLWFYFGEVFSIAKIRCCVRCWGPFGLAQLLGGSGGRGATALPVVRGSALLPWVIRPARRADPTSWSRQARPLPWFRADGRYSVPLFAAQSRHEKPYPPMSKIKFRLAFERQDGNSMPHSPAQRKRDFGKLKFCAR